MNIKIHFALCLLSLFSLWLGAQEGNVGIGTTMPDSSALLDLFSSKKGLLLPRVTLEAFNDSSSPVSGPADCLLIYHTGDNGIKKGFYYWDGRAWVGLCSCPAPSLDVQITPSDTAIRQGSDITLTATVTPSSGSYTYQWQEGGNDIGRGTSLTLSQPSVGRHTYTVIVTGSDGRWGRVSATVIVRNFLAGINTFTIVTDDDTVAFNMVAVPGGEFLMGAQKTDETGPNYDNEATTNEKPVHRVNLTDYAIGETEVTQALWYAVMGSWPSSRPNDQNGRGDNYPMYNVKWNDVTRDGGFLAKLNQALENQLCGMRFVLPTEAQWEYAAAGGGAGYNADGSRKHKFSGSDNADDVAWHSSNAAGKTHPVKGKAANELGLYDMSGNVCEWCSDLFGAYTGSPTGTQVVVRNGSFKHQKKFSRVAVRNPGNPANGNFSNGFRLALVNP